MSLQSDHKALVFIAAVAILGAGVRVVRAAGRGDGPTAQPALERQVQSADSASRAGRGGKGKARKPARRPVADSISRKPSAPRSGKLDLDIATAVQLDSVPGVSTAMAKRIVADRMMRGPFVTRDGLRRVPGVGPAFLAKIDSLVTFSGTVVQPSASDTVIARVGKPRSKRASRPPP
jgi:DNA uptake protein ComE-like DNA-binding protein